jgi:hypothetical protein
MPVLLGEVEVPTGILLVLDPGLGRFWRHDGDPHSPRRSASIAIQERLS